MSRIERNDTKTSNSGKKIKSFWQNGKKEPFILAHPLLNLYAWSSKTSLDVKIRYNRTSMSR